MPESRPPSPGGAGPSGNTNLRGIPSPMDALREAHRLPMMGAPRRRLMQLLGIVAGALARAPHPLVEEQLLALNGRLAARDRRPDAVRQLMDAARMAAGRGAGLLAVRHRLAAVVALARTGRMDVAQARLRELALAAAGKPELADAWRFACMVCGRGDVRAHAEALLGLLESPLDDHLRYDVLVLLGELHLDGGDSGRARALLREAGDLARRWEDAAGAVHADAMVGNLLVDAGLFADARPVLDRCVAEAAARGDDLTVLSQGTVLAALLLTAEDWAAAERVARQLLSAAERRGNWLGIADAAMTWSTALVGMGEHDAAVKVLVRVGGLLRDRGAAAAFNLMKARLGELRATLGAEVVDPLLG